MNPLDTLFPSDNRIASGIGAERPPPHAGGMVTVARRFNSLEAELLRGRLEADGIPATLGDSQTVQTDSLLTVALGGVRIRVPADYERQALRTIADVEDGAFALEESSQLFDDADDADADADALDAGHATVFSLARDAGLPLVVGGAACVFFVGALVVALTH